MIYKKILAFSKLGLPDKLFFLKVLSVLLFSKLVVLLVPFRKVMPYLGRHNAGFRALLNTTEQEKAERVRHFMFMVSNNVKWNSVCLDQAMATAILLNKAKVPNCICLGVRKNEKAGKLDAHAWVLCGGTILIGGQRSRSYTEVARFSRDF